MDTHNREFGYNIDFTSPRGKCGVSKETRIKMSQNKKDKRKVIVYTIYGNYFKSFNDLYECSRYFNTAAANIHRKMNILKNKKNLIDSELSKYILTDENIDISHIQVYWNNIIEQFKNSSGNYKIFDCYNDFVGISNVRDIQKILRTTNSINYNIKRGTYFKTFKFVK